MRAHQVRATGQKITRFTRYIEMRWRIHSLARHRASRVGEASAYTRRSAERKTEMLENKRTRPTASVAPPKPPLLLSHPPSAPLLPPAHIVDLMTVEGSAVFDAQWKGM